jgi:hypothetical protein
VRLRDPAARRRRGRPSSCPPDVLTRVVRLRLDGWTLRDIGDSLNAQDVPTPGGGKHWWPSRVCRLLGTLDAQALIDDHDPLR